MSSFEIPDGPAAIKLVSQSVKGKPVQMAQATYTVTNTSDQTLTCRLKPAPEGDTLADWLDIQGEKERPFGPSETQKVTVNITVPVDASKPPSQTPVDHKFRLQAMNVNDPGNDFAQSAVTTFTEAPHVTTSKVPPWIYIVIAVVLVLVVGGVLWLVLHGGGGSTNNTTNGTNTPPANTAQAVPVPDVSSHHNLTYAGAVAILNEHGFTNVTQLNGVANGAPPTTVMSQDPAPDTAVATTTAVQLTVDPGVTVPSGLVGRRVDGTSGIQLGNQLSGFNVNSVSYPDIRTSPIDSRINTIASVYPASGTFEKGHAMTIDVHAYCPPPPAPPCIRRIIPWVVSNHVVSPISH